MKLQSARRQVPQSFREGFDEFVQDFLAPVFRGRREEHAPTDWPELFRGELIPPMDVAETEKDYTLTLELPGLDEKDIRIELMGRQLRVFGERKWEREGKEAKDYHRIERRYGAFERFVTLPEGLRLDREAIVATCRKGVLEVRIPKLEPTPASRIAVKPG